MSAKTSSSNNELQFKVNESQSTVARFCSHLVKMGHYENPTPNL